MGWTANTNSRGDKGLPWKTPDWTEKRAVCQPLKATLAVVPACRRLTHRCAPAPNPTAAMHRSIQGLSSLSKANRRQACSCPSHSGVLSHAWCQACVESGLLGREGPMFG